MTELAQTSPKAVSVAEPDDREVFEALSQGQKAAIILGVLGADRAGPLLEQMDEETLRNFALCMARIRKIQPEVVRATIIEFLDEIERLEMTVHGGVSEAKVILEDYVNEETLTRILDDVDSPSAKTVWKKLSKVDDAALAEFLSHEHPQTVAVVLSKLPAEHAARLLGRLSEERARDIVLGLTRTASLDPRVIDAIGQSVSRDFLSKQRNEEPGFKPADKIGAIMNYAPGNIRHSVLSFLNDQSTRRYLRRRAKRIRIEDSQQKGSSICSFSSSPL